MRYIEYISFKIFKTIVLLFPKVIAKQMLHFFSFLTYTLDVKHKKVVFDNLDIAFGDTISHARKNEIMKNSYRNMLYGLYEFIANQHLSFEALELKVKNIIDEKYMLDALQSKKPIIIITAHYGNWEFITSYFSLKYRPLTVVGRALDNELLNDELIEARNKHNSIMLERRGAGKGLIRAIKEGRMVGLVIDQHAGEDFGGIRIKFFGHDALQSDSVSRLALKFDAIILPVFIIPLDLGAYEIKFCKPIETISGDVTQITQLQSDIIEEQIKIYPDIWFWQHKRWKLWKKY